MIRNRLEEIPEIFLPPRGEAGPDDPCFSAMFDAAPSYGGRLPTLDGLRSLCDVLAAQYDALVRDGRVPERPPIFVCVNSRCHVHVAIGEKETDLLKEAIELQPNAYPLMVERPGGPGFP